MLNLDMVGRLREDKLTVGGSGTAAGFNELLDRANQACRFQLNKKPSGYGPSDHLSFNVHNVPVLFFFTDLHSDYHRPSDTADRLNLQGMRRVAGMVAQVAAALADADKRPQYVAVPPDSGRPGSKPR
jgi:Zn-dependent M28 family amino/carboxypeptidase